MTKFTRNKISLSDLDVIASDISRILEGGDVVILKGDIGAGKTTLVAHIADHLGITDSITSPTFSIVNTFSISEPANDLKKLIHIDTYRLNQLNEVYDLGVETLFEDSAVTFVEWGEKIEDYIDKDHFVIEIDESNPEDRDFELQIKGELSQERHNHIEHELVTGGWTKYV